MTPGFAFLTTAMRMIGSAWKCLTHIAYRGRICYLKNFRFQEEWNIFRQNLECLAW